MKISNQNPTKHIFIGLMDYRVDHENSINSEYGFGYFELNDYSISKLNKFHDDWDKGIRNYSGIILEIREMFLINSDYINNQTVENNYDFKGVKLDSINFLESKPNLEYPIMIKGKGDIIAYRSNFIIQCEDMVDRGISHTIYRSSVLSYWKINHLLRRSHPI